MRRATGIIALLSENEMGKATAGTIDGLTDMPLESADEEGIVGAGIPNIGYMPLVVLDTGGTKLQSDMMKMMEEMGAKAVRASKRRVEVVRFGENGREHIKWINP